MKIKKTHLFILSSFLFMVLVYSIKTFESEKNYEVYAESFDAVGNDTTDDTMAIQNAVDHVNESGGGTVVLSKGVYLIDTLKSIVMKDNVTLFVKVGAALKAIPNSSPAYEMIRIRDVENVSISGEGKLIGDRKEHTGTEGEWGFGINIMGAESVKIKDISIEGFWGDGIYVGVSEEKGYSKDVSIINTTLRNNRRQGISIVSAKTLLIEDVIISDTNGTLPESGIDLEPNYPNHFLKDIKIVNPSLINNKGHGLLIHLLNLDRTSNPVNVEVEFKENALEDTIKIDKPSDVEGDIEITH